MKMGFAMHTKNMNSKDYNYIFLVMLFVCFSGTVFLMWKSVQAGTIYATMLIGTAAMMFLLFFWLKDDNTLKPVTNYIKIPISTNMPLAAFMFIFGSIAPFVIQVFFGLFSASYNVSSFSIPLAANDLELGLQSFSSAEVGASMPWRIFLIKYVAGVVETFTYNFGLILFGIVIGYTILYLANDAKPMTGFNRFFVVAVGFLVAGLYFVISHFFNGTYGPTEFVVAFIFLMIANLSIYLAGFFLLFWVGYHMSNNLIWLIQKYGFLSVAEGYVSVFGFIEIAFFALIVYYAIRKWPEVWKALTKWL